MIEYFPILHKVKNLIIINKMIYSNKNMKKMKKLLLQFVSWCWDKVKIDLIFKAMI